MERLTVAQRLRLLKLDDAEELTDVLRRNREFLAPWEPQRPDSFFDVDVRREAIRGFLEEHDAGRMVPFVISGPTGEIAGRLNLNGVTYGAFQSASMGYWVRGDMNGKGLATGAVRDALRHAFSDLKLHRVQAETLLNNLASQRVLRKAGFRPFGIAPDYLHIAGRWQDHLLFNVFAGDRIPS